MSDQRIIPDFYSFRPEHYGPQISAYKPLKHPGEQIKTELERLVQTWSNATGLIRDSTSFALGKDLEAQTPAFGNFARRILNESALSQKIIQNLEQPLNNSLSKSTDSGLQFLRSLHELPPKTLSFVLTDARALEEYSKISQVLTPAELRTARKTLRVLKPEALETLLKMSTGTDGKELAKVLTSVGAIPGGPTTFAGLTHATSKLFALLDIPIAKSRGINFLKSTAKIAPVLGALPATYDAIQMQKISNETNSPEIRALAQLTRDLNTTDAGLGILESTGIAAGVGLPLNIALAATTFVLQDIITTAREEELAGRFEPSTAMKMFLSATS